MNTKNYFFLRKITNDNYNYYCYYNGLVAILKPVHFSYNTYEDVRVRCKTKKFKNQFCNLKRIYKNI